MEAGLKYVYEGNVPGEGGENTGCPCCRTLLVRRYGYLIEQDLVENGACPICGCRMDGVWE
jgi:pyruvate formate lyase activating enzyme